MNDRQLYVKTAGGAGKRRKRRNSKYERCKAALKEEMNMSLEAAEVAMMATRQNKVWLLRPFNSNFSMNHYESNYHAETESSVRQDIESKGLKRLHTEQSRFRSVQRKNTLPIRSQLSIRRDLDRIINPQEEEEHKCEDPLRPVATPIKQHQDTIFDEHLSEFSKAKEEEQAFRRRISTRFIQRFPDHLKTEPDLLASEVMATQSRQAARSMMSPRNVDSRNSNGKRWTYFYSRSKKRCFMQRYVGPERKEEQKIDHPALTFINYLWDKNVRKSLSNTNPKHRCENLARSKEHILSIEKPGSKRQLRLRECLDKILMDNMHN